MGNFKRKSILWGDIQPIHPNFTRVQALPPNQEIPPAVLRCPVIPRGEIADRESLSALWEPQTLPDLSQGLQRRHAKRDIVHLEQFVVSSSKLMVLDGTLCLFCPPCWKRLTKQQAEVHIWETLSGPGLTDYLTQKEFSAIYELLLIDPKLQIPYIPASPHWKLNLRDGTLDLNTRQMTASDPNDYFFRFIDIFCDDLLNDSPEGPMFEAFVSQLSGGNPDVRQQLLELTALAVLGHPIKHFFVLLGPSNTGKTQFGRFLEELVGRAHTVSIQGVNDFGNRFTAGSLMGKTLVTCLDLPDGPLPPAAIGSIKQLVGDDSMKGEVKYQNPVTFYEKPLLVCAGNHPIQIPHMGQEGALLNRMVTIPFTNPVAPHKMHQQLYQDLLAEAPYILREALTAFYVLKQRNFQITRSKIPEEYCPQDSRQDYQSVQYFIEECCELTPDGSASTQDLYKAFCAWSGRQLSAIEFSRYLREALKQFPEASPVKRTAQQGTRGYIGICLKPDFA